MCDICSDLLNLIRCHDERIAEGNGLQLSKKEILAVTVYVQLWQQRQCMCCYRDLKHYEKINNIVQVILNKAICLIQNLGKDEIKEITIKDNEASEKDKEVTGEVQQKKEQELELSSENKNEEDNVYMETGQGDAGKNPCSEKPNSDQQETPKDTDTNDKNVKEDQDEKLDADSSEDAEKPQSVKEHDENNKSGHVGGEEKLTKSQDDIEKKQEAKEVDGDKCEAKPEQDNSQNQPAGEESSHGKEGKEDEEEWTLDDKDAVFQFVTKVFLLNFPMYLAYKHMVHSPLEELSQQDAAALNNYCELTDPEVPVFLLRNVCFFCDCNGIQSIAQCFDRCSTKSLPYNVGHTLINLIANLRLWMNMATVMQYIVPLRNHVIGYMCRLSDTDLRLAGTRNMTDLMWAAVKEPMEGHYQFDKEGLELAFKYFTCTTLTIRLAGITQINSQIQMYNELALKESIMDTDSGLGNQLADWLIEHKVVDHLFGPNLHVEIIKQSELILTLIAMESRLGTEHIDCIWAAGQLKHCGRTVLDILTPLIKHMDAIPVQHLLRLVTDMDPSAHTEQTLFLASALIKYIWNSASNQQMVAHHQSVRHSQCRENMPCEHTSSEHSDSDEDLEEGEVIMPAGVYMGPSHHMARRGTTTTRVKSAYVRPHIRGKPSRVPHRHQHHHHEQHGMTSEEGNTDLSNVSEDSLPSDLSDSERLAAKQQQQCHHRHHHGRRNLHHHAHHHHHHHHHENDTSSEEEEEEEDEDDEEMEELDEMEELERQMVEEEEEDSDEDEAVAVATAMAAKQHMQAVRRARACKDRMSTSGGSDVESSPDKHQFNKPKPRLKPKVLPKKTSPLKKNPTAGKSPNKKSPKASPEKKAKSANHSIKLLTQSSDKEGENNPTNDNIEKTVAEDDNMSVSNQTQSPKSSEQQEESNSKHTEEVSKSPSDNDKNNSSNSSGFIGPVLGTIRPGPEASEQMNVSGEETKLNQSSDMEAGVSTAPLREESGAVGSEEGEDQEAGGQKEDPHQIQAQQQQKHHQEVCDGQCGCDECSGNFHDMDTSEELSTSGELRALKGHHHTALEEMNSSDEAALLQEMGRRTYAGKPMTPEELNMYLEHLHAIAQKDGHSINSELIDEILSPDEASCNSSRISAKSEKNMADFEGEDLMSEEELAHINATAAAAARDNNGHKHQRFVDGNAHGQPLCEHGDGIKSHHPAQLWKFFRFEDVCKPGNTLLWDLIQEPTISRLPEGLALEVEKILTTLVCFVNEKRIRTKFIEACVQNLANHRSVVISMHLLSKILGSFQQFREGELNTHTVTKWAEKELQLMKHFIDDLVFYTNLNRKGLRPHNSLYTHKEEIQVRLQFLTCVFTSAGSPDSFRLNLQQVDTIWNCLATDAECFDELFSWLLTQSKTKEHHALGLDAFKHVFLEKMPTLEPEGMSMIGLNLFTQLCSLARIANASMENPLPDEQIGGMDQLWGIALKAHNTDVSLTAIQYLNTYYITYGCGALDKEDEFVQRCMSSLITASAQLEQNPESSLLMIQRGLILMTNHLESFRKRYAFHLRNWQLEGKGIFSHQKDIKEKQSSLIRVLLQPAGASERTQLEMLSTDLVAELRAEVTRWWENLQRQHKAKLKETGDLDGNGGVAGKAGVSSLLTPILGAMLGEGPIRMITGGQELSVDLDERTLSEVQLKDSQMVFVSLGAHRSTRKQDGTMPPSHLPAPSRGKIPMMLLLGEPYFHQLFSLLQWLSKFRPVTQLDQQEQYSLQTKARVLSRKVWDLIMLLPTNTTMLRGFQSIGQKPQDEIKWSELLDDTSPHKLMYSLQIVEYLSKPPKLRKASIFLSRSDSRPESLESEMSIDDGEIPEEVWSKKFVSNGGLKHLFQIFLSGTLQIVDINNGWSEWNQDCLASLLRLLSQFAVLQADMEGQEDVFDNTESPRKKMKRMKSSERVVIPRLNKTIIDMVDVDNVVQILLTIIKEAAMPPREYSHWPLASWGRVEVIRYAFAFLISFAYSCDNVQPVLCNHPMFTSWLKRITLEAPEPPVRQEACQGIYRLCLGKTSDGLTGYRYLMPVLTSLLSHIDAAQQMRAPKRRIQEEKEPFGPACRDYFWIVCRLTDGITHSDAVATWEESHAGTSSSSGSISSDPSMLNLNILVHRVAELILNRNFLESRHSTVEDDALIGILSLETSLIKHNPPYKSSSEGQAFLVEVFWCLFALPSPAQRFLPKCKAQASRSIAFDLLVELVKGNVENYAILHSKLIQQHSKESHAPYSWDLWPHEEERSSTGFVGLTNLGATCYMATCMQHLYMIPEARKTMLEARCDPDNNKYYNTLMELKKMMAYLLESERKAYNPRSFCKVYMMDHQPLNTGEQKDMTEFFTDLITKMEEMGPELRRMVKRLFGGVLTNNVVSLDCPHVSRTKEEFYTVRCQVADMRNLHESLDEVTVKDMLEGDNMYTCSKCQKKVRAEKRACFKRLPQILCFNTMRYTFNMVTMMKEKVNTHFSFPMRLDMSSYMENNLIKKERLQADESEKSDSEEDYVESQEFELTGVTVHTGTAEGGHYYSFIRDKLTKNELGQYKWYLFNDAEVKPFDSCQIASECYGGEMTSKTYDSVTDKFMDFSFEKTNSAYMLFYERISNKHRDEPMKSTDTEMETDIKYKVELSPELNDWIWQDNMQFLKDKNIFEHTYFGFLWQMCGYLPTTLPRDDPHQRVPLMATQLGTSFVLETLIHAKEKPTMLQWIEIVTKQFNSCHKACEWFLDHMAQDDWWPQQILIKCPTQLVRQMFHRLLIHVITQLKPSQTQYYLQPDSEEEEDPVNIGNRSCVTRFIKKMLAIMTSGSRPHCKYLSEYFALLYDFAKMGDAESQFMLQVNAINTMVLFFMSHKTQETFVSVEILSDDDEDEEDDVVAVNEDKYRPQSLEKMISLVAMLVEKSRSEDNRIDLAEKDLAALIGGKGFPFLYNQIKDCINIRHTCNLIFSVTRWNDRLAIAIIQMIFTSITRLGVESQPFFKLLSLLVEFVGGPPGLPPFTHYILQKFWEVAEYCPQQSLEWLSNQVMRNKLAHAWTLQHMEVWVEPFLLANNNVRVRNAAAFLVIALIPSNHFRQSFRNTRSMLSPCKDKMLMSEESIVVLHDVYTQLLRLLGRAKQYCDAQQHGATKLVPYFTVMTHCLISRTEKLLFTRFFPDLWNLFQPKLSEPAISMHTNKQALLHFWHQACVDCPENVQLIVTNPHVSKNIAFNYILADHDDQDVMVFNRSMLPAYYGILRMACQASRSFTRQLAAHQNIQWAFKNITPYPGQYTLAVEELFKMMRLMVNQHQDQTDDELRGVLRFKRETLSLYLQHLDARTHWQTLSTVLKIVVETSEDRMLVLQRGGLLMLHEAFSTVHMMHHEATACHVSSDLVDILKLVLNMLKPVRAALTEKGKAAEMKQLAAGWKEKADFIHKLLTLLNSYQPPDVRNATFDVLKEMVITFQNDCLPSIVPMLVQCHTAFQDSSMPITVGPYFPKRGQKSITHKMNVRPMRPNFQMYLQSNLLECTKGVDEMYDMALTDFYQPYHTLVDLLVRVAVNQQCVSERIVQLSAMVAYEGVPLHLPLFAKLWYEIYQSEHVDRKCIQMLCANSSFIDYVDGVLLDERASLNNMHIYQFFLNFFPKVYTQVLNDQGETLFDNIIQSIHINRESLEHPELSERDMHKILNKINGDLKALLLIFSVQRPREMSDTLIHNLAYINHICRSIQRNRAAAMAAARQRETEGQDRETGESDIPRKRRKTNSDSELSPPAGGFRNTKQNKPSTSRHTSTGSASSDEQTKPTCESDDQDSKKQQQPRAADNMEKSGDHEPTVDSSGSKTGNKRKNSSDSDSVASGESKDVKDLRENVKNDESMETGKADSKDADEEPQQASTQQQETSRPGSDDSIDVVGGGVDEPMSQPKGKSTTSNDSDKEPKPSTSKQSSSLFDEEPVASTSKSTNNPQQEDNDNKQSSDNSKSKQQKVSTGGGRNRAQQGRERPTMLDHVIRNIESIFAMLGPK